MQFDLEKEKIKSGRTLLKDKSIVNILNSTIYFLLWTDCLVKTNQINSQN
jgi:hypothetical protein